MHRLLWTAMIDVDDKDMWLSGLLVHLFMFHNQTLLALVRQ
jgi:hypothetical protein